MQASISNSTPRQTGSGSIRLHLRNEISLHHINGSTPRHGPRLGGAGCRNANSEDIKIAVHVQIDAGQPLDAADGRGVFIEGSHTSVRRRCCIILPYSHGSCDSGDYRINWAFLCAAHRLLLRRRRLELLLSPEVQTGT